MSFNLANIPGMSAIGPIYSRCFRSNLREIVEAGGEIDVFVLTVYGLLFTIIVYWLSGGLSFRQ